MKYLKIIIGICLLHCLKIEAQQYNLTMDRFQYDLIDRAMQEKGNNQHTTVKPYRMADVKKAINPDTAAGVKLKDNKFNKRWVGRKLFSENFLKLDSNDYQLYIDPLFSLDIGKDQLTGNTTYLNARGIQVFGNIGKKVSFYTSFWENQGRFVNYVVSFILK